MKCQAKTSSTKKKTKVSESYLERELSEVKRLTKLLDQACIELKQVKKLERILDQAYDELVEAQNSVQQVGDGFALQIFKLKKDNEKLEKRIALLESRFQPTDRFSKLKNVIDMNSHKL